MNEISLEEENELATLALDVCFKIHRKFGPGLFESVYKKLFDYEFKKLNVPYARQVEVPLIHDDLKIETAFIADFIIADTIILEFKSVEALAKVHYKQVQTYLKLTKLRLGLLINFNNDFLKEGIKRVVNTY